MTPREPDRFDAQAREMLDVLSRAQWSEKDLINAVADRLRAAEASAPERAAQGFDELASMSVDLDSDAAARQIRALIPPAAAPAASPLTSGQRAQVSLAEHRLRLKALFEENERRPLPDTALRAALLDADRFVDEFCTLATAPIAPAADYDPITAPTPAGDMNGPHGPAPAAEPRLDNLAAESPAPVAETGKAHCPTPYRCRTGHHDMCPAATAPAQGPWRVGNHYQIHVYEGDRPVATFLSPEDARRCVHAVNGAVPPKDPPAP